MIKKCDCLDVKYMPIQWTDGRTEERWMCLECKSIFFRKKSSDEINEMFIKIYENSSDVNEHSITIDKDRLESVLSEYVL